MIKGLSPLFYSNPSLLFQFNRIWRELWPKEAEDVFVYWIDLGEIEHLSMTMKGAKFKERAYLENDFTDKYMVEDSKITKVVSKEIVADRM